MLLGWTLGGPAVPARPTQPAVPHSAAVADATAAEVISALGTASTAGAITGVSFFGAPMQVAAHTAPIAAAGFPTEGGSFLMVTSGDASQDGGSNVSLSPNCVPDEVLPGNACDVGGVEVSIAVPATAGAIEFDARYVSWEFLGDPYEDPFRVYLVAGGTTTKVAEMTLSLDGSPDPSVIWSPTLHHYSVDVSAYAGQTVTLRFQAEDYDPYPNDGYVDNGYDSGAAIDNLTFAASGSTTPQGSGGPPASTLVGVVIKNHDGAPVHPNLSSRGTLPVSVFADFDLSQIDVSSLTLGADASSTTHVASAGGRPMASLSTDGGHPVLRLQFRISDLTSNGDLDSSTAVLLLSGRLQDGTPIEGGAGIRNLCATQTNRRCAR